MKKSLILACLLGFAVPALAGGNSNNSDTINNYGDTITNNQGGAGGAGGTGIGIAGASSSAAASSSVKNNNLNLQGQQQGQLQGQSQSTSNSNNASLSVGGSTTIVKSQEIPVATAYAPNNFPTATCRIALSGGLQLMHIGISGGGSVLDENCAINETARGFSADGYKVDALHIRCTLKWAQSAPSCIALKNAEKELAPEKAAAIDSHLTDEVVSLKKQEDSEQYVKSNFLGVSY